MRVSPFSAAAAIAMILALGLALRIYSQSTGFHSMVNQSLATTEGYDQKFIDMVDRLEVILTRRASFAYPGGKDPMTGRRREVAEPVSIPTPRRIAAIKSPAPKAAPDTSKPKETPPDNVKLTAIIADDYGQHTAIVMDGERSISVDVGDNVGKRKVTRITAKDITMEDDSVIYLYDISGNRNYQRK